MKRIYIPKHKFWVDVPETADTEVEIKRITNKYNNTPDTNEKDTSKVL